MCIVQLLFSNAYSLNDYYADVNIVVDASGYTTITGTTNHPLLKVVQNSAELTSKKGAYWTLNIAINSTFSDFVYLVDLPANSVINYVKSSGTFNIQNKDNKLIVTGYGQNKPFNIIVQYKLDGLETVFNFLSYSTIFLIIFLIILLSYGYYYIKNKKQLKNDSKNYNLLSSQSKESISDVKSQLLEKSRYNISDLTTRQKEIMQILLSEDRAFTQKELQDTLSLPKSSVSRNIHSLELRGYIELEKTGMSNLIRLKTK